MGSGLQAEISELKWFPRGNVRGLVEKLQWELRDRAEMLKTRALALSKDNLCIFFLPVWYGDTNAEKVISKPAFQMGSLTRGLRDQKLLADFCIQL